MIGEEVRRRREGLGLTGAQLAARAGMAPSAVSQIETGKRTPSSTSVIKLAAALGIEVGELYPKGQSPLPLNKSPRMPEQGPLAEEAARASEEYWMKSVGAEKSKAPAAENPPIFDVVHSAALRQAVQDWQAFKRAIESEQIQAYFVRHEAEAMDNLLERPLGEIAAAYIDLMRGYVELEHENARLKAEISEAENRPTESRSL